MVKSFGDLEKYDKSGMLDRLSRFPTQCEEALSLGEAFGIPADLEKASFTRLVTTGMGGSGITGFLLKRFLDIPVLVNKGYQLPHYLTEKDLLIAISYSGNTEETLSALEEGLQMGMKMLLISSDGKFKKIAEAKGLPLIQIPKKIQPRAATGYLFLPLLKILSRLKITQLAQAHVDDLLGTLDDLSSKLNKSVSEDANPAKNMARKLLGRVPLIYGTNGNTEVVANRWKTQFNENAKQPAFWNVIPEVDHNELVGFTSQDLFPNCRVLFLRNSYDLERNQTRITIMKSLLSDYGVGFEEIEAEGKNELSQILAQIYMGDFVSVYLALLNKIDPTPVEIIEDFKKKMVK